MKSIAIFVVAVMLCPAFAFAADPVAVDETIVAAEDTGGNVTDEAVVVDELYAPATEQDIKAEANEEMKDVKAEAKAEVKEIKAEEKEALKEAKM